MLPQDSTSKDKTAVVIGAGVAGMAAAIRLAHQGLSVTVLERHSHLGGKIRTTPSAAGPVDAGPTVLTMRHVFDELFDLAGEQLDNCVTLVPQDILARHFWPDGSQLDLFSDRAKSINAVKEFAGSTSAQEFDQFCSRAERLFDAFDRPIIQAEKPQLLSLVRHVLTNPKLIPLMSPVSSLSGMLRRQFTDPRLRQLFGRYATYVGGAPHLSPAVLALIWHAEASGVWVVKGGMHKLANAMAALARKLGVRIVCNAHVERIELQSERVAAVHLTDGTRFPTSTVVNAGDPRALATGAFGPSVQNVGRATVQSPRSLSARVYSFAANVAGPELAHHNVFFASDSSEFTDLVSGKIPRNPTLYLCAQDRGQNAHLGMERFEIIVNAPATAHVEALKDLDQWHHHTMTQMQAFGVTFSPTPTPQKITTPQMFARLFPESMGALYGQTPHGLTAAFKRPTARTAVPGLYLCGGGTHPGAGVPMATLSAKHVAEVIWSDQTSTSTSAQTVMRGGMSTA